LDVPGALDTAIVRRLFPWVEIALGVWLLLATGPALAVVAGFTVALFLAYLVLVARALRRPEPVDCGCFGAFGDSQVTTITLWRNVALVLTAALSVVAGLRGFGVIGSVVEGGALAWLAATALTVTVAVLATYRPAASTDLDDDAVAPGSGGSVDEDGDYVREAAPLLSFLDEDGALVSLENALHEGAHLLVFLSPHCEPCLRVAPLVPEWASRLGPVRVRAVLRGTPHLLTGRDDLAVLRGHAWFDPYSIARRQLGTGSPGAVLVGLDGLLVVEFVDDVLERLREAGVTGRAGGESGEAGDAAGDSGEVSDAR
jgi:hypothetical protein